MAISFMIILKSCKSSFWRWLYFSNLRLSLSQSEESKIRWYYLHVARELTPWTHTLVRGSKQSDEMLDMHCILCTYSISSQLHFFLNLKKWKSKHSFKSLCQFLFCGVMSKCFLCRWSKFQGDSRNKLKNINYNLLE